MTVERVARNEAIFREANERIQATADAVASDIELIPFICECSGSACVELVRLSRPQYEEARSDGAQFFVARGHEVTHVDGAEIARIVRREEHYSLMQKVAEAGAIARRLDPRANKEVA